MCLPNTYIMYGQTANTAHTRMLPIEPIQFECGTLFEFTAINHETDCFFSHSFVLFSLWAVHLVCWSHLYRHILWNVYVYFGVQMRCNVEFLANIMTNETYKKCTQSLSRRIWAHFDAEWKICIEWPFLILKLKSNQIPTLITEIAINVQNYEISGWHLFQTFDSMTILLWTFCLFRTKFVKTLLQSHLRSVGCVCVRMSSSDGVYWRQNHAFGLKLIYCP